MEQIHNLNKVFSNPHYKNAFFLIIIALIPVFAVTSDIVTPYNLELNPIADPLKILMILAIVLLIALNIVILLYAYDERKRTSKQTTVLGAGTALFTTACPICQPIWLVWIGLGSSTAFLAKISIYLSILSLFFLTLSLYQSLKAVSNKCEVNGVGTKI